MTDPLIVQDEDPVELDGSIDVSSDLQLAHDSDILVNYDQRLQAEHSNLEEPSGVIRIKLIDFSHGGYNWEMSASHDGFGGPVGWSRGSGHAYYDFGPMTSELEVDVTATNDDSPPANKQVIIKVKTKPIDVQPS